MLLLALASLVFVVTLRCPFTGGSVPSAFLAALLGNDRVTPASIATGCAPGRIILPLLLLLPPLPTDCLRRLRAGALHMHRRGRFYAGVRPTPLTDCLSASCAPGPV
ncbi:unnamed protein product [Durusdinium trenchii]|uniref:Secreted protein n=1 Tax=Durusdinium trenchii TaxID=1381693 RepID=A0ABP0JTX3_9DINO